MADYEVYQARADEQRALDLAATTSPFTIVVRFIAGLTQRQQEAFAAAADRWVRVIVGDLPEMLVGDELIDDVLISAQGRPIDGPGHILGSAGPRELRPPEAGAAAFLPATGSMSFDTADLARMEADGRLNDVITHEMGHVLGIGTIWDDKGLLRTPAPTTLSSPAPVPWRNTACSAARRTCVRSRSRTRVGLDLATATGGSSSSATN